MKLSVAPPQVLYENPQPLLVSRQAAFAGLAPLGGDEILAMFSIGQAFDAADQRMHCARSLDGGASWSTPWLMHDGLDGRLESESFKPLALGDRRLMALGYVFERPDMTTPIVHPATRALLPLVNKVSWSDDGGASWTTPRAISIDGAPLELSGPAIRASDGRLLAVAAPFTLAPTGHEGWLIESRDEGESWRRLSVFFRAPEPASIAPWECRLAELAPGRLAVMIWAYDLAADANLNNQVAVSEDGGASFGPPIDTGIMGQASNLMPLGPQEALSIHCHRSQPVSLTVRRLHVEQGRVELLEQADIFAAEAMSSESGDIAAQFGSLKFGQPSLLPLGPGRALAAWWQVQNCQHVIRTAQISWRSG